MIRINEIKHKQDENRQINESRAARTDAQMKSIVGQSKKMVADIKSFNAINEELTNDNTIIRYI
jgi:hypothetical protein